MNPESFDLCRPRSHRCRGPPQPPAQLALRARHSLREGRQHRRQRRAGRLLRREDRPLAEGQARRQDIPHRRTTSGGDRSTSSSTRRPSQINRERAIDYLNTRERLYCFDGFAGWDPKYRIKVRVICSRPYHALFMHTMLIRPTTRGTGELRQARLRHLQRRRVSRQPPHDRHDLEDEHRPEPRGPRVRHPRHRVRRRDEEGRLHDHELPHAEARRALDALLGDGGPGRPARSSLLFGLSGTGKTTLSADPKRQLIGDDEHCWSDDGIFNIEGGCYAKAINLTPESEPDIFQALRFGAVLENVVLDDDHDVDFTDTSITREHARRYPIEFIPNAKIPCVAGHPTDVIFLTCDAFGVLPPVSALSPAQAMYHFISGYTAKVAGTEMGVNEPQATFSPCFGGPFLVWHPSKYAELLAEKMQQAQARVWLVNTGWSGGGYGVGKRIKLKHTRAIIDAIHGGALAKAQDRARSVFGFDVVTECPVCPSEILRPARHLGRQGRLRRDGEEARRPVQRELQDLRGRRQRRGEGRGAHRLVGEELPFPRRIAFRLTLSAAPSETTSAPRGV